MVFEEMLFLTKSPFELPLLLTTQTVWKYLL